MGADGSARVGAGALSCGAITGGAPTAGGATGVGFVDVCACAADDDNASAADSKIGQGLTAHSPVLDRWTAIFGHRAARQNAGFKALV
jgi:hypothetical protein